jgi:hypothetical protein
VSSQLFEAAVEEPGDGGLASPKVLADLRQRPAVPVLKLQRLSLRSPGSTCTRTSKSR